MAEGRDADLLEILVAHLGQDVHRDLEGEEVRRGEVRIGKERLGEVRRGKGTQNEEIQGDFLTGPP